MCRGRALTVLAHLEYLFPDCVLLAEYVEDRGDNEHTQQRGTGTGEACFESERGRVLALGTAKRG